MIGPYEISPFINNRIINSACGIGNVDSKDTFNVSTYTSGDPLTVGFAVQGCDGARLDSGDPINRMRLWIDNLFSNVDFTIDTPKLIVSGFSQFILPATFENMVQINNTLTVESTTLLNGYVQINNDVNILGITTLYNDLNIFDGIFNMVYGGVNLLTISTTTTDFYDSNIHSNGLATFNNVYNVSSATIHNKSIIANAVTINFSGNQTDSYTIAMTANITSLVLSNGVNNGVYNIFLNGGVSAHTLNKILGGNIKTTAAGDINIGANSTWVGRTTYNGTYYLINWTNYT